MAFSVWRIGPATYAIRDTPYAPLTEASHRGFRPTEVAGVDLLGRPFDRDRLVPGRHLHGYSPTLALDLHPSSPCLAAQVVRNRGRGAGSTAKRLAHPALPDADAQPIGRQLLPPDHAGSDGIQAEVLDPGPKVEKLRVGR